MVRGPFYDKNGIKRGAWSSEEDEKLRAYVERFGHWNWRELPKFAGLARCGKSCRLRWINYLRPDVRRGNYSTEEESLIIKLHEQHGNKWSLIAAQLPGRTDNEVKNHWHTHLKKRSKSNNNSTESLTPQEDDDLSPDSSQFCDRTSHNDDEEATNQAESSSTSTSTSATLTAPLLCSPRILESSHFSPVDTSMSADYKLTSSNVDEESNLIRPRADCGLGQGDHNIINNLSSSFEACDLGYYYSTGSDFWTEPFMEDKIININTSQTGFDQAYNFGGDGRISSPYPSFYDDGMDYLFSQL